MSDGSQWVDCKSPRQTPVKFFLALPLPFHCRLNHTRCMGVSWGSKFEHPPLTILPIKLWVVCRWHELERTPLNRQGGQSMDFHRSLRIYWHYIYKCRNARPNCQVASCISQGCVHWGKTFKPTEPITIDVDFSESHFANGRLTLKTSYTTIFYWSWLFRFINLISRSKSQIGKTMYSIIFFCACVCA